LRFYGVGADGEQILHQLGTRTIGKTEMLRVARRHSLKAKVRSTTFDRLANTPLPAIAALKDGGFVVVAKADDRKILLQAPNEPRPSLLSREQFEAIWNRELVMMTRRGSLLHLARRFDISWFMGAIWKYRRMFTEVLVASFFLQIFALVSPLIFQVVIDKVLVHQSMSTLDVLAIGLAGIAIFECVLTILRTYLFSQTTNRIDVELGARLFRHLLALPMAYFRARRAGDSVARVRELENIRNFLTSSALTLVIDLVFTFVFIAIMFMYSTVLTIVVLASLPLYAIISAGATPLFKRRLDEKFRLGAENQAFLVESLNGVETLKAMAVEPQMQRRWEEQLANYVAASMKVLQAEVSAGGGLYVSSGGRASGTVVSAGGGLYVQSGGTSISGTVLSGGVEYVSSGGTISGAILSAGFLEIRSGGTAGTSQINFTTGGTGGGTLQLDNSVNFHGVISGFGVPGALDLRDIAFGSNTTLGFVETGNNFSGTLTVSDGTNTANPAGPVCRRQLHQAERRQWGYVNY
jgi:autotransporter passenger strand-loop-strand repeat protein